MNFKFIITRIDNFDLYDQNITSENSFTLFVYFNFELYEKYNQMRIDNFNLLFSQFILFDYFNRYFYWIHII